jgi:hypothetical protein
MADTKVDSAMVAALNEERSAVLQRLDSYNRAREDSDPNIYASIRGGQPRRRRHSITARDDRSHGMVNASEQRDFAPIHPARQ